MNIQNVGKRPGIREAFIPRPGHLFAQCDYPTLELYTLAQCCFSLLGESALGDALNSGQDPHLWFAAKMLGITYEDAAKRKKDPEVKRARQLAKAANFGFPGGMGVKKFVTATRKGVMAAARAEGVDPKQAWADLNLREDDVPEKACTVHEDCRQYPELGFACAKAKGKSAKQLKADWFTAFPEMAAWFSRADSLRDERFDNTVDQGKGAIETLFTKRHRGMATYCARCNTPFQGLASDCAKRAGWLIAKQQYTDPSGPLWNTRTVAFVHDEFILEVPDDDRAHDAAVELARLMTVGANEYLPDVPIPLSKMEPLLMRRWSKNAQPKFDSRGRLAPSDI